MSPILNPSVEEREALISGRAKSEKWDPEYFGHVSASMKETTDRVKKAKRDWGFILGRRCYFKAMRSDAALDRASILPNISAPVLILYGRNDANIAPQRSGYLDNLLSGYDNIKRTTAYFSYLGHFLGKLINNGLEKMRYDVDDEVILSIKDWLNSTIVAPAAPDETAGG
jgi:pimeloyl-ACP methyl ester carboxylesterase